MRSGMLLRSTVLALSLALGGCGGDDGGGVFTPSMTNVAGTYHATTFTAGSLNLLALGGTVNVTLTSDGNTAGHLTVPGLGPGGSNIDEDLAGTWTLAGNTVTFSQTNGTLIQGAPFTAEENTLTATGTFDGENLLIVLSKT